MKRHALWVIALAAASQAVRAQVPDTVDDPRDIRKISSPGEGGCFFPNSVNRMFLYAPIEPPKSSFAGAPVLILNDPVVPSRPWYLTAPVPAAEPTQFRGFSAGLDFDQIIRDSRFTAPSRTVYDVTPTTKPAGPPAAPSTQATQPVNRDIKALIDSLGDDSPKVREDAHTQLKKLGKAAVPALAEAAKMDDPQIRTSAQALITEIAEKDKPPVTDNALADGGVFLLPNGNGQLLLRAQRLNNLQGNVQIQMQVVANGNATRDMTVNQNGHKVHIHEDNNGLKMEVTDNGETKEYSAKNAAELKEKEPEAYKIYEKYSAVGKPVRIEVAPQ